MLMLLAVDVVLVVVVAVVGVIVVVVISARYIVGDASAVLGVAEGGAKGSLPSRAVMSADAAEELEAWATEGPETL